MTQKNGDYLGIGNVYPYSTVQGGRPPESYDLNLTRDALHRALNGADEVRDSWLKSPPDTLMPGLPEDDMKPSIITLDLNVFPMERNALVSTAFKNCESNALPLHQS